MSGMHRQRTRGYDVSSQSHAVCPSVQSATRNPLQDCPRGPCPASGTFSALRHLAAPLGAPWTARSMQRGLRSATSECADRQKHQMLICMPGKVCGTHHCALLHLHLCEALNVVLRPRPIPMTGLCCCPHGQSFPQAAPGVTLPSPSTMMPECSSDTLHDAHTCEDYVGRPGH